jgi:hypothetical protein
MDFAIKSGEIAPSTKTFLTFPFIMSNVRKKWK